MGCVIGTYNLIDSATLTLGSWVASLPLTNIQTKLLGQVARTGNTSIGSTQIGIDLGSAKTAQILSLVNHNISLQGTIRVRATNDPSFTTSIYDSGVVSVWPSVYNTLDLEWEDSSWWSGQYLAEDIAGYTPQFVALAPSAIVARYWWVQIEDTTNSAGVIDVGRIFLGPAWIPERSAEVGLSLGWNSDTQMQKALNGTRYYRQRNPYRTTRFSLDTLDVDDAMAAFDLDAITGIDEEVLWIQESTDTLHALRRRYLGTIRQLTPIEMGSVDYYKKSYEIEEIV